MFWLEASKGAETHRSQAGPVRPCSTSEVYCNANGRRDRLFQPKQLLRIAIGNFGLLLLGQVQSLKRGKGLRQGNLREIRAQQHMVDADIADGADELILDG